MKNFIAKKNSLNIYFLQILNKIKIFNGRNMHKTAISKK